MIYLSSIKPLDVPEHAFGTPLIIEVYVLHTYNSKTGIIPLYFRGRMGFRFGGDIGTACVRGDEAL